MAGVPRYEKLKQLLREKIVEDGLNVGDRFLSQNDLIRRYRLSYSTVTRALNELEQEGYLIREPGRGTFVRAVPGASKGPGAADRLVQIFIPWDYRDPGHLNVQQLYGTIEASLPLGYRIKMVPYTPSAEELEQYLFPREKIDGAIFVHPSDLQIRFIERFARSYPSVVLGRVLDSNETSCVYVDNRKAAETAVNYLLELGHAAVGLLVNTQETAEARDRLEGYRAALRAHQLQYDEALTVFTHPLHLNGFSGLLQLMDRNSDKLVTAVFAAHDLLALGALEAAHSMGKQVPGDLSIMGFDDISEAASFNPPLTTMHVPVADLARWAVQLAAQMIDQGASPQKIEFTAHVVERNTVARLATRSGI